MSIGSTRRKRGTTRVQNSSSSRAIDEKRIATTVREIAWLPLTLGVRSDPRKMEFQMPQSVISDAILQYTSQDEDRLSQAITVVRGSMTRTLSSVRETRGVTYV
jgi:hypothetical protein